MLERKPEGRQGTSPLVPGSKCKGRAAVYRPLEVGTSCLFEAGVEKGQRRRGSERRSMHVEATKSTSFYSRRLWRLNRQVA